MFQHSDPQTTPVDSASTAGAEGVPAQPDAPAIPGRPLTVYKVSERATGRAYIGITVRPVPVRFAAHCRAARVGRGRPGTLAAAIRAALARGEAPKDAFAVETIDVAQGPDEARYLERTHIAGHWTQAPAGFNIMPGGASLGGPANAVALAIRHPRLGTTTYPSLSLAVAAINVERAGRGAPPLDPPGVYARIAMGWSPDEALGLVPHFDRRGRRDGFVWRGRQEHGLRAVAAAEGLGIDTMRSRLQRAREAGRVGSDVACDHRRRGHRPVVRAAALLLPHPYQDTGTVNAALFARLTGLARATVLHRYHRLRRSGRNVAALPRAALVTALTGETDRRVVVSLVLADGTVLGGGVRALIRRVLSDHGLEADRAERIGASAIRARLRRLPGWPDAPDPSGVAWAFGFNADGGRPSDKCVTVLQ